MITVMTSLIELRSRIKYYYGRYSAYVDPVLRFLLALCVIIGINRTLGFMSFLKNPFIVFLLSLICAIMPTAVTVAVAAIMIVAHCYALAIDIGAAALILILLMLILYLRFASKSSTHLLLTPFAFAFHIPGIMPISAGLLGNPASGFAIACSIIMYRFIRQVSDNATTLKGMKLTQIPEKMKLVLGGVFQDQSMYLSIMACLVVVIAVYLIRRLTLDYAWRIAIAAGSVLYLIVMVVGGLFLDITQSMGTLILGTLVSGLLALILDFFVFNADYTRTEYLQFEDDDYFYYVKAVPKVSITAANRQIKTIRDEEEPEQKTSEKDESERQSEVDASEVAKIYKEMKPIKERQIRKEDEKQEKQRREAKVMEEEPILDDANLEGYDFESKLEESLKDL